MSQRNRFVRRHRKGQGLVEYAILLGGVALVCLAAVAIFGHKTNDMLAAMATVLPGVHADDNGPMESGKFIETTPAGVDPIALDVDTIATNTGTPRLGNNIGLVTPADFGGLVLEAN